MFQSDLPGAGVLTLHPAESTGGDYETVRHMLFGSLTAVQNTIKLLHKLNYAEPNDWTKPMSTGRPNEVMSILTKRVKVA